MWYTADITVIHTAYCATVHAEILQKFTVNVRGINCAKAKQLIAPQKRKPV